MSEPDEQTLTDLVKRGDRTAMRLMYSRYIGHLTAVCSRYIADDEDVKDVLQDSFIKIFSSIGDFTYKGAVSLKSWLTKIVINESLSFIRSRRKLPLSSLEDETVTYRQEDIEPPEAEEIPPEMIHRLIRQLPEGYRTVFNLHVLDGQSHKDIARLLGISENTSASQLHRAKATLAKEITKHMDTYGRQG